MHCNYHRISIFFSLFLFERTSFVENVTAFTNHSSIVRIKRGELPGKTGNGAVPVPEMTSSIPLQAMKVAIIGAGAAGLATARAFSRKGIEALVLEKDDSTGGVWKYNVNLSKERPMYRGLRTNLPREVMAFREMKWGGDGVTTSYVSHREVAQYLEEYASKHDLKRLISYGCLVKQLSLCDRSQVTSLSKIMLEWEERDGSEECIRHSKVFDAVCICNGHYALPSTPSLPGLNKFRGKIMHSIEYDDPKDFVGLKVVLVGGRASGTDMAREISNYANKVFLSDTSCPMLKDGLPIDVENVSWVPRTVMVDEHSAVHFEKPCSVRPQDIDVIIFCTGYDYQFPFINENSKLDLSVAAGERRIMPLFEQMWNAHHPNIAFVGLQHSVVPFPFFEIQAEAIVAQLLKQSPFPLPDLDDRVFAAARDAEGGGPQNQRVQDTHYLGSHQWDWCRKYAEYAGVNDSNYGKFIIQTRLSTMIRAQGGKVQYPAGPMNTDIIHMLEMKKPNRSQ